MLCFQTTNDFVILVVERPLYDKGVICLPTREAALELEKKDVKLSSFELDQGRFFSFKKRILICNRALNRERTIRRQTEKS